MSNEKVVECVKVIKQALRPFGDEKFRCNKEIKIRPNLAQLTQWPLNASSHYLRPTGIKHLKSRSDQLENFETILGNLQKYGHA